MTPGATAETARIEYAGQTRFVIEWEAEAALELARENPTRSLELYEAILAGFPQYAKAWYNKAVILHTVFREYDRALDAYNRARLLSEMRRTEEAMAGYDAVLRIDPAYLMSLEGYGALLINAGAPEKAEPLLERAIRIYEKKGKDPYRSQQLLATAYSNLGRNKEALKAIDAAMKAHPKDDSLWEARGIAYSNMEKYREAVECLTEALRINRMNRFAFDTRTQLLEVCRQHKIHFTPGQLAF